MKQVGFAGCVIVFLLIIIWGFWGCSKDGISVNPTSPSAISSEQQATNGGSISAKRNRGAIDFFWNGTLVGTYYIVGSYNGGDGSNSDGGIFSRKSRGFGNAYVGGIFEKLPYTLTLRPKNANTFFVSVNLGPAQADFRTLSLPLDPPGKQFEKFSFSGSGYGVGCANDWKQRSGSGGFFRDIPTPCNIPGAGSVGAARAFRRDDGEITSTSLGVKIKRVYLSGDCNDILFFNHPGTNNIERSFRGYPDPTPGIQEGETLTCSEEISVIPLK